MKKYDYKHFDDLQTRFSLHSFDLAHKDMYSFLLSIKTFAFF
jgi:hypothetical protein